MALGWTHRHRHTHILMHEQKQFQEIRHVQPSATCAWFNNTNKEILFRYFQVIHCGWPANNVLHIMRTMALFPILDIRRSILLLLMVCKICCALTK